MHPPSAESSRLYVDQGCCVTISSELRQPAPDGGENFFHSSEPYEAHQDISLMFYKARTIAGEQGTLQEAVCKLCREILGTQLS